MVNLDLHKFWVMKEFQERDPYVSRKPLCLQYDQFNTISLRFTGVEFVLPHIPNLDIRRSRGEFRPRQTRQLPRAVDLKGRLLSCQSY